VCFPGPVSCRVHSSGVGDPAGGGGARASDGDVPGPGFVASAAADAAVRSPSTRVFAGGLCGRFGGDGLGGGCGGTPVVAESVGAPAGEEGWGAFGEVGAATGAGSYGRRQRRPVRSNPQARQ
jgi:hypothetical protein